MTMGRLTMAPAALALGLLACASSKEGPPPPADVPLADVPALYGEAVCEQLEACAGLLADVLLGGQDCTSLFVPALTDGALPLWEGAVEAGTLVYDATKVAGCLDAIAAGGCDVFLDRDIAPCDEALEGLVPEGDPCIVDAECAGATFCRFDSACPGICTARRGEGASCTDDAQCESGRSCQEGTCRAPAAPGAACGGASLPDCQLPFVCLGEDEDAGAPGTCRRLDEALSARVGEACDPTAGLLCVDGAFCVLNDFVVVTMTLEWLCVGPSSSGGPCKLGLPDPCPSGEYCDADPEATGSLDGTCQPLPGPGEACRSADLGGACRPGLQCSSTGRCAAVQRTGGACAADDQCASGNCAGGICADPSCDG